MERLSGFLKTKPGKILTWVWENILFLESLFLLLFIPLYPKLPLLDIQNTWVYIRVEDFVILFVILSWLTLLVRKKITLKTPLTLPILAFWIIGGIATIHGILLIFPTISNAYPNVAFLSLIRHIEYLSLFFIGYQGMKDKRLLPVMVSVVVIGLIGVIIYGFGQKYLGFPAFLTMNEEFAKGIPIRLSELSRVPSTFAGHYDLAAYLVLVIPILVNLALGLKNWLIRIFLAGVSLAGIALLLMTVSRVSFFVLFISLGFLLFFQKRKLVIALVPLILIGGIFFVTFQSSLFDRFKSTVSEADVLVDAATGESIGHVRFVEKEYFRDKIVLQRTVRDQEELANAIKDSQKESVDPEEAIILPYRLIPNEVPILTAVNISTGENLPQGTGYTNLYLSPVIKRANSFFIEIPQNLQSSPSGEQALVLRGNFIVKRASAYDLSFTTRFQGEWPRAIDAFKKNLLVGSGYGSVSLAVDNNYLRILGEVGILGFLAFFLLFLILGIYVKKIYPDIDSPLAKSFVLGFVAGVIGLSLNAILIDVFEASKIAFLLWILVGVVFGILRIYQVHSFTVSNEVKKILASSYAIIIYLFVFCVVLFSPMLNNYFVADDFTWLRWAADSSNSSPVSLFTSYFLNSDGFFYRPGMKIYFFFMYQIFWLNQVVYHLSSLMLHFASTVLFFLIARKIFKDVKLGAFSAFTFLVLSGPLENVFWISSIGHLFNGVFSLLALLLFIFWDEKRKIYYLISSILSICIALTFHELGVVAPLLMIAYKIYKNGIADSVKTLPKQIENFVLFIPVVGYLLLRIVSKSHWFSGDYSYDPFNLPFNLVGNIFGYFSLGIIGPMSLSLYNSVRVFARENLIIVAITIPLILVAGFFIYKIFKNVFDNHEKRIILFGLMFFVITLLPFLGLGNITSRYSYLSTMGIIFILSLVFKKLYGYLLNSGKEIAVGASTVVVIVFALFHLIQNQSTFFNWHEAGNKTKRFFISMESLYTSYWSQKDTEFHFVNVPTRDGQAWVFPVGLADAVWFAFKNDDAKVFIHSDDKSAVEAAGDSLSHPVFRFIDGGNVEEVERKAKPTTDLIMP